MIFLVRLFAGHFCFLVNSFAVSSKLVRFPCPERLVTVWWAEPGCVPELYYRFLFLLCVFPPIPFCPGISSLPAKDFETLFCTVFLLPLFCSDSVFVIWVLLFGLARSVAVICLYPNSVVIASVLYSAILCFDSWLLFASCQSYVWCSGAEF